MSRDPILKEEVDRNHGRHVPIRWRTDAHHGNSRGVKKVNGLVVQGLSREVDRRTELEVGQEGKVRYLNKQRRWLRNRF